MDRALLLMATLSLSCASTGATVVEPGGSATLEVEESLREAESLVDAGDAAKARALIAESEERVRRELGADPDRHQLLAHAAELRARLDGPKRTLTSAVVAPAPVVVAPAPVVVAEPAKELAEAPKEVAEAPKEVAEAAKESADAPSQEEDPVAAFAKGPLRDRGKALQKIRSAKRAPKKKSRRLYAEARALLQGCADEGGRLVSSPDLQNKSFRIGSQRRTASWIVVECKSKARSLDRRLKKKFRQS